MEEEKNIIEDVNTVNVQWPAAAGVRNLILKTYNIIVNYFLNQKHEHFFNKNMNS